jgi:membrane protein implicated in regulation of membrane protease activity
VNGWLWLIAALALAAIELLVPGWVFMGLAASVGLMGVLLLSGLWTAGLPVTLVVTALISALVFRRLWPAGPGERRDSDE